METKKTNDYSIFNFHKANRDLSSPAIQLLKDSISIRNMLHLKPILVNANMEVIDGQHRLVAAQQLGVEIYYQIDEQVKIEDMGLLNSSSRVWKGKDFLKFYCNQGYEEYLKLNNFLEKNKISLTQYVRLTTRGGNSSALFREGRFTFPSQEAEERISSQLKSINLIKEAIQRFSLNKKPFINEVRFVVALMILIKKEGFELQTFLSKYELLSERLRKAVDTDTYLSQLLHIYNYRNSSPLGE